MFSLSSCPAQAGHPVITSRGFVSQTCGYWIARSSRAMTTVVVSRRLRLSFFRRGDRARGLDVVDVAGGVAKQPQDFFGVLAEQGRALHLGDGVRHFHRVADGE